MNKELLLEALDTLRTQVEGALLVVMGSEDDNDAHYSKFFQDKLSDINVEINKLNTTANG